MKANPMTDHNAKLHQFCPFRCRLQVSDRRTTSLSPDTPERTCSFYVSNYYLMSLSSALKSVFFCPSTRRCC
jgi:hypothetical protein